MEAKHYLDARELEGRGRAALFPAVSSFQGSGVGGGIRPGEVRPQVAPLRSHPASWPVPPGSSEKVPNPAEAGSGFLKA